MLRNVLPLALQLLISTALSQQILTGNLNVLDTVNVLPSEKDSDS
jgi:hypothetical protein